MIDDKYDFNAVDKKFIRGLRTVDRPNDELEKLLIDIMPKVRKYAEMKKYNTYWYYDTLNEAYEILDDIYTWLDYPTLAAYETYSNKDTNHRLTCCKESKHLWRIYPEGTLAMGSDKWPMKGSTEYNYYSPVAYPDINEPVQKYVAASYLHHPYVTWALINAYLLDTGRRFLLGLDDKYGGELYLNKFSFFSTFFKSIFKHPFNFSSGLIYKVFSNESTFNAFLDGLNKKKKKDIRIEYSVIGGVTILSLLTGYIKIAFGISAGYLIIHFIGRKLQRKELNYLVDFLHKLKEDVDSLNKSWLAANKAVVDIKEIRDLSLKTHSRVPYPDILFSLFSATGNSKQLDVSAWI